MLDDINIIKQRNASGVLDLMARCDEQLTLPLQVANPGYSKQPISSIIFTGMGGSALAADIITTYLTGILDVPVQVVKGYTLPHYANASTFVIAASYSGNTEETLSVVQQSREKNCQIAFVTSSGELSSISEMTNACTVLLPKGMQPRMTTIYQLRALLLLLEHFEIITPDVRSNVESLAGWLRETTGAWGYTMPVEHNLAKQIALHAAGKNAVFLSGPTLAALAYKWKISWNENAKNTAFYNVYPEFNHNEFIGWSSHPIDKPFAIFNLTTLLDSDRIMQRFALSDRLLSGKRPQPQTIVVPGDTYFEQSIAGCVLADYASIYLAVLNGVSPEPVALIESLKAELANF